LTHPRKSGRSRDLRSCSFRELLTGEAERLLSEEKKRREKRRTPDPEEGTRDASKGEIGENVLGRPYKIKRRSEMEDSGNV